MSERFEHLGDEAELAALGLLDESERATLEAHVVQCDACAQRVGEAESVAASLASTLPGGAARAGGRRPIARPTRWASLAAALVVLAGFAWALAVGYGARGELRRTDTALATIVHGHFNHVSLAGKSDGVAFTTKVLYAKDGSWLYVIVDPAVPNMRVEATIAGAQRDLGAPLQSERIATLFARTPMRVSAVELRRGRKLLASGSLRY